MELDACSICQILHGLIKCEILSLLDVVEDVTALSAAKAVPKASVSPYVERGGFLMMKGAAPPKIATPPLAQLHGLSHQRDKIDGVAYLLALFIGDHGASLPGRGDLCASLQRTGEISFKGPSP